MRSKEMGEGQRIKKTFRFPLDVMQNSVVSTYN